MININSNICYTKVGSLICLLDHQHSNQWAPYSQRTAALRLVVALDLLFSNNDLHVARQSAPPHAAVSPDLLSSNNNLHVARFNFDWRASRIFKFRDQLRLELTYQKFSTVSEISCNFYRVDEDITIFDCLLYVSKFINNFQLYPRSVETLSQLDVYRNFQLYQDDLRYDHPELNVQMVT